MKKIAKILAMFAIFALAFSFAGCKSDDSDSSDDDVTISGGTTSGSSEQIPEVFVKIPAVSIAGTESWTPSSKVFVSGRKIEIASFYMSDHPVTRGEYKAVIGSDPSDASAYDKDGNKLTGDDVKNNPVNNITWYDALVYCNTRSIKEKLTPCYTIDGKTDPKDWGTVPVSSDTPSTGSASDSCRVRRGGCWYLDAKYAQIALREHDFPNFRSNYRGFRVVRTAK